MQPYYWCTKSMIPTASKCLQLAGMRASRSICNHNLRFIASMFLPNEWWVGTGVAQASRLTVDCREQSLHRATGWFSREFRFLPLRPSPCEELQVVPERSTRARKRFSACVEAWLSVFCQLKNCLPYFEWIIYDGQRAFWGKCSHLVSTSRTMMIHGRCRKTGTGSG